MKKNLKKAMAMGLATTMALAAPAAVSAAGDTSDVSGSHVFMFKSVGNAFLILYGAGWGKLHREITGGDICSSAGTAH